MKDMSSMLLDKVIKIGEDVSSIKTTMSEHDRIFTDIKNTLYKIDSKHNADYQQYIKSREDMEKRITPLEDDYRERCKYKEENRIGVKRIFFSSLEKAVIYIGGTIIGLILTWHTFSDFFVEYFKSK